MSSKFGRKLLADLQQASDKFSIFSLDSTYLSTFFDAADDVGDDAETRTPENVSKSKFQNAGIFEPMKLNCFRYKKIDIKISSTYDHYILFLSLKTSV